MNGGRVWGTTFVLVKHGEEKEQNFRQFFFAHHMGTDHNGILHHAKIAEKQKGNYFFFSVGHATRVSHLFRVECQTLAVARNK
jgi:hypothetical protein